MSKRTQNADSSYEQTRRALIIMSGDIAAMDDVVHDIKLQFRALCEEHGVDPAAMVVS